MTRRKHDIVRHFAPRLASRETMAYLLDISTDTFDRLVAAGKIQKPRAVGGIMRWPVEGVLARIEEDEDAIGGNSEGEVDEETRDRDDIRAGTARVFGRPARQRRTA